MRNSSSEPSIQLSDLQTERVNLLNHVDLAGPGGHNRGPDGEQKWIKALREKLQNMSNALKRLPNKSQAEWEKTIQNLADMLPKE
jgi:hypothetical protein